MKQLLLFNVCKNTPSYTNLSPILKWTGGKEKELPYIKAYSPSSYVNYYEPFVGGGSVFTAINAEHLYINDKSRELVSLYNCIASSDASFYNFNSIIIDAWNGLLSFADQHRELCDWYIEFANGNLLESDLLLRLKNFIESEWKNIDILVKDDICWHRDIFYNELVKNFSRKLLRMKKLDNVRGKMTKDDIFNNIETAFMSSLYMYFRGIYNDHALMAFNTSLEAAVFLFIRNFAYSGMFRYNTNGDFNVPYGGIAYNHKNMEKKISYYQSKELLEHFGKTTIENMDFEDFFQKHVPGENDFIFLDPPYDSKFSTYAQNEFGRADQERLADYLYSKCKAKWQMIIKYTPFIYSLYDRPGLYIAKFDKKYQVSFMNRNDKECEHLIITNYKVLKD